MRTPEEQQRYLEKDRFQASDPPSPKANWLPWLILLFPVTLAPWWVTALLIAAIALFLWLKTSHPPPSNF